MGNNAMRSNFELLAPGGDIESIKAAIVAGADAIYCGLDNFNARNRATNITFEDLNGIVRVAHQRDCKIFLTLNIMILESEIPAVIRLLNKLVNTKIDGVILQDLGLFHLIKQHFPTLDVHASTQVNSHNEGQILFMGQLNASRVNLSRELNIKEIKHLAQFGHQHNVLMEVFVHGSYCIGFSGLCYISSAKNGNSGNRGRCSQPCRDQYQTTAAGKDYPLNMKDNSAFSNLEALADAGVYSLKVEGRIKKSHYVYTVVDNWSRQLDNYCTQKPLLADTRELYTVFNRDFSNSYLMGDINKAMFIDNPRDNSVDHFAQIAEAKSETEIQAVKRKLYDDKTTIIQTVEERIADLDISLLALELTIIGQVEQPLIIRVTTPLQQFEVASTSILRQSDNTVLDSDCFEKRFRSLNNGEYLLAPMDVSQLATGVVVPFKELTYMRDQIACVLNGDQPLVEPFELPKAVRKPLAAMMPRLSVLIANPADIEAVSQPNTAVYYQLPEAMAMEGLKLVSLFQENPQLIPWFPAILLGDNYQAAVTFLDQVKPSRLVTNNSGVGYAAHQLGLAWIAGPQMNISNSLSLECLQQEFGCVGAFISNEIKRSQIKPIVAPAGFELYYSIYHPMMLLMSRQCLFHQTVGCKKKRFDDKCLRKCDKSASIINLTEASFVVDKQRGDHNALYNPENFLNLGIVAEIKDKFTGFMVDLRDIKTDTQVTVSKAELTALFNQYLAGDELARNELTRSEIEAVVIGHTCNQYTKGL